MALKLWSKALGVREMCQLGTRDKSGAESMQVGDAYEKKGAEDNYVVVEEGEIGAALSHRLRRLHLSRVVGTLCRCNGQRHGEPNSEIT